ncbi:penicillin-binding protein activator [Acinetobacter sp. A3.8]|uniref:Penicillin-binding protein activator n=1 Tax=Acinetobacter sedimenti TaxID=2919922 RepID=A0A9X2B7E6_9GAMM|nr:penicillin-binding protein activator [Acinetobacter sedimenti]MCJ8147037.1 penicillin-binding protein activator [Acinetobacter sedimenti]
MFKKNFGKYAAVLTTNLAMLSGVMITTVAHAEILVILPETGPMASASDSIKRGLVQANHNANEKYKFHFVDVYKKDISKILKQHVGKSTQLVIGPLDKNNVEELVFSKPKIQTLALNQIDKQTKSVFQFALSKDEDAQALTKRMQWDGVDQLVVLRDPNSIEQTQSFYDAMQKLWGDKMQVQTKLDLKSKLPFFNRDKQGVLLLGSGKWLSQQNHLPKKNIYTLPYAIEEKFRIAKGMVYCDTPAIYTHQWADVIEAYKQKPVVIPYQRLIAFGADAWQISDELLKRKGNQTIQFQGRTGQIRIVDSILSRSPQCFQSQGDKQKVL